MKHHHTEASMWAVSRAVGTFTQQAVSSLAQATTDAAQACACIRAGLCLITLDGDDGTAAQQQLCLLEAQEQELRQQAAAVGWGVIRAVFLDEQFQPWASAVLAVAAGEWLPRLTGAEQDTLSQLVTDTFMQCPPWHALSALLGHLAAVSPHDTRQQHGSSASVTALGADTAAQLLQQRFLAPGSSGLQELLAACEASTACAGHDGCSCSTQPQHQPQVSPQQLQEAAVLLAALPERLQLLRPVVLELPSVQDVVTNLMHNCVSFIAVAEASTSTASCRTSSSSSSSDRGPACAPAVALCQCSFAAAGAVQLAAALMQKLVLRGHSSTVAAVLLDLAVQGAAAAAGGGCGKCSGALDSTGQLKEQGQQQQQQPQGLDSAQPFTLPAVQQVLWAMLSNQQATAVEKLVVRLLCSAAANVSCPTSATQPQQQQQHQQQEEAELLLLSPLLAVSAQLRVLTSSKLLLSRTLPASALGLLLQLLAACTPPLLPEAAAALAAAWCDSSTIVHVPVAQQAYMTAALVACIQQLPQGVLDPATSAGTASAATVAADAHAHSTAATAALQAAAAVAAQRSLSLSCEPYTKPAVGHTPALLTSIIQGVSARLASPSPAIRLQAMRVGRAFSRVLDPSSPLFVEAGPLELMSEELWPGAQAAASQQQQHQQPEQQQDGQQAGDVLSNSTVVGRSDGSSATSVPALARLAEATAAADSDDEEGAADPSDCALEHAAARAAGAAGTAGPTAARAADAWEGASETGSEGSGSSLVAFDLQDDLSAEQWWGPDGLGPVDSKALGLRTIAAALRKQDDMWGALEALKKVEVLVRAEPDELPVVAPELARALLYCKVPISSTSSPPAAAGAAGAAAGAVPQPSSFPSLGPSDVPTLPPKGLSSNAEVQRQRALTAVLSLSPLTTGDTVIAELYSPNLDQYQRMLILDGLAAAAAEMSDPRRAPQLALQGHQQAPELLPPAAAAAAKKGTQRALPAGPSTAPHSSNSSGSGGSGSNGSDGSSAHGASSQPSKPQLVAPGLAESSSRVWGKVSLQKKQEQAAAAASSSNGSSSSSARTFRNRFAPVALRWAAALLQQCDVKQQGIDLFGRDSLLLGRLLTVLGSFVEAAAETPAAVPLCAGLLELVRAPEVSGHREAFVRRSALVAASQVVRNLPPARLAGAMVGRQADPQDTVLVERLQWLMSWAQQVAGADVDQHCRLLAAGCVAWHLELSEGALSVLQHLPEPEGPSLAAVGAGSRGKRGAGKQEGISIQLPSVERLVLS